QQAEYWVGIGSPACVALRDALGDRLGRERPLLCLGVTNPEHLRLVGPAPHAEGRRVAAVHYGRGLRNYAALLHGHIFRDLDESRRLLSFVYNPDIEHDAAAAEDLKGHPLHADAAGRRLFFRPWQG